MSASAVNDAISRVGAANYAFEHNTEYDTREESGKPYYSHEELGQLQRLITQELSRLSTPAQQKKFLSGLEERNVLWRIFAIKDVAAHVREGQRGENTKSVLEFVHWFREKQGAIEGALKKSKPAPNDARVALDALPETEREEAVALLERLKVAKPAARMRVLEQYDTDNLKNKSREFCTWFRAVAEKHADAYSQVVRKQLAVAKPQQVKLPAPIKTGK